MACVIWEKEYDLGIPKIDQQHQRFAATLNKLCDDVEGGLDAIKLVEVLEELHEYVNEHLAYEEELFAKFNYEHTKEHVAQHTIFRKKLKEIQRDFDQGRLSVMYDAMSFLGKWFVEHVLDQDRKYLDCFHRNGL